MKMKMWVGVGDQGNFIYWPSLSTNKLDCRRKIYDYLYAPLGDTFILSDWLFKQVKVRWVKPDEKEIGGEKE